jgi:hypothetical protein
MKTLLFYEMHNKFGVCGVIIVVLQFDQVQKEEINNTFKILF